MTDAVHRYIISRAGSPDIVVEARTGPEALRAAGIERDGVETRIRRVRHRSHKKVTVFAPRGLARWKPPAVRVN